MILRLVFSFFFFSLVTGNPRLEDSQKTAKTGACLNKVCVCQDQLDLSTDLPYSSPLLSALPQALPTITTPSLRVKEGLYGYPLHSLISANRFSTNPQTHIETKSYDVDFMSDESPSLQVQRPVQYVEEDTHYTEKTICFTPSMVHRMIKAALEYVSQIPSDINKIIDKIDLEVNRMSDQEYKEDNVAKKPLYPLDSKTIFQMLNKPISEQRTNLILKYELPGVQEPQCREALEKLIEIAYNVYLELEKHPPCREYLYKFASQQPEDRPKGHLERGPDLKSLIASILDQIEKRKPNLNVVPDNNRYGDIELPEIPISNIPIPKIHEYNVPPIQEIKTIHEYSIPQKPQIFEYNIPEIHEYNVPQIQEVKTQIHEYSVPQKTQILEYNIPQKTQILEYSIPQKTQILEYSIPQKTQILEYNIPQMPQSLEYNVPQTPTTLEYNIPTVHEYNVPQVHEYRFTTTQSNEYIPQIQDITIPQVQEIEIPEIHETIEEIVPMQPEETINVLIKLLQKSDHPDYRNLFDRVINIVEENQNNFHPNVFKLLLTLLSAHKQHKIPRFNDIFLLLLDSQRNQQWPWSDRVTEHILSYLVPDQTGNLDSRIVDIILNLYKNQPNDKYVEYVLSLLRPFKDGNLDTNIADIILNLISSNQNNLLHPDYSDILLKLLKPSQNGIGNTKELDIINNLIRWNEIGISPNQLDVLFALLKPYVNGNADKRLINIIHFLLTQGKHLNPKHLDFILSFLYPENGILDTRRIDIIHFLLNNVVQYPKHVNILLTLLQQNAPAVLNSKFLEILLLLNSNRLLTPELLDTIINLLNNEVTGQVEDNQVKTLFFQLAPLKHSNPKLVVDILTLLNQGGLHGNIIEWLETTNNNAGLPNRETKPSNVHVVVEKVNQPQNNEFRTPDVGYQTPDSDLISIFKWLDSQGLLNPDQGANNDLVNKILKILQMGERELGVVELTYMLKHEKPLIYQPVYYVKYRLPILSFISNLKTLLLENPHLNANPMKLLQELIVISNVTEVSPNLQGYPKEEILKLTFNDGDLVQAKILDEQNLSLNDQIKYVHGLNSDISPEEILQLNRINEAKYFPNLLEVKGVHPEKLTVNEVDRFIEIPPVQYQQVQSIPRVTHTIHQTYIERSNQEPNPPQPKNAQVSSEE